MAAGPESCANAKAEHLALWLDELRARACACTQSMGRIHDLGNEAAGAEKNRKHNLS